MTLNRIRPHLDDELRPNQCGFCEKDEQLNKSLPAEELLEVFMKKNLSAVITFIIFKKPFDPIIHRGKIVKILSAYSSQKLLFMQSRILTRILLSLVVVYNSPRFNRMYAVTILFSDPMRAKELYGCTFLSLFLHDFPRYNLVELCDHLVVHMSTIYYSSFEM